MAPTFSWEELSDHFQLAIIAKGNRDIENLLNPIKTHQPQPPALKIPTENEMKVQRKAQLERNMQEQKRYDAEEAASIKAETKQFNGITIKEADQKLRPMLYLALGNKRKRIFGQKFT